MPTENLLDKAKKDGVKFISLQITDLLGLIKEVVIPVDQFKDALEDGVWFDGSSIEGFARIQESDLFLKPDPSTYCVVPWLTENGKTARVICDIYGSDGKPFEGDPRFILKKVCAQVAEMGYEYNVGPEPEFYLFKKTDIIAPIPVDLSSYFDISSHEGYKFIKRIIVALKDFGIRVEASHHEVGRGQYEVDISYGGCLEIADKLLTLKYAVKNIAQMYDLNATFMPKPIMGAPGNGMHIHQSLFDVKTGKNAFFDAKDKYNLSQLAYNFIAGQMKHIKALCGVICPTVNSYKRLISGFEAPVYITWASMNRSALIRVPRWFKQRPKSARIELRCPDPSCNPYLAFAAALMAGLDGVKNNLMPPKAVEENVYQFDDLSLITRKIDMLPSSLLEALDELKKSELLREVLGDELFRRYIDIKTKEWNEFKVQVTSWERSKYMNIY
ncbi:MAG: glutamine synthetase family protein [Candidatus Hodarchaeota archaeon]